MEIRIVVFVALICVTIITNTLVLLFAYRTFAGLTSKLTSGISEFSKRAETRELIESMRSTAEHAAALTESIKVRMQDVDPVLRRTEEDYRSALSAVDSRVAKAAKDINTAAHTMRDAVAKPAFAVVSFAAGIRRVLNDQ